MKLLVIGHGCDPNTGSEPGMTWNWAYRLAKTHTVHLIAHPHSRDAVEAYLRNHPNHGLHLNWVTVPARLDPWDPNIGSRGIKLHYIIWLRRAFLFARRLHRGLEFDLVHHVGWGTVSVASPFWKLGIPLVWGPLGGGQITPKALISVYGEAAMLERLRTVRIAALRFSPSLRKSVSKASLLLATNRETRDVLGKLGARRVELLPDSGIPKAYIPAGVHDRSRHKGLTLLWAGRIIPLKCLELALRSVAAVHPRYSVKLIVAGDGSDRPRCEELVTNLQIGDRVEFRGKVDWKRMPSLFVEGDAFLFTSVRESFGSVVLEAMSYGLPVVSLDLGGVATFCPSEAVIKVPSSSPEETVGRFASAIVTLHDSESLRLRMSFAARRAASLHTWEDRVSQMTERYASLLEEATLSRCGEVELRCES
ncbi:MAG: glycosyltransferase family 4 protein [Bryobacteraceae bacterium]